MDIQTLLNLLNKEGDVTRLTRDPFAQFGSEMLRKTYLGARFLPERLMTGSNNNVIREEETRFRTVIAEDSGRYDPVPLRHRTEVNDMSVEMGNFDIGREIDGSEYDAIIEMLARSQDSSAKAKLLLLVDTMLNQALKDKKEKQRWQAIIDAKVRIEKSNGQEYDVLLQDPPGHRIVSPNFFSDNSFDPFEILFDSINVLKNIGFGNIQAIVSTFAPISAMAKNEQVRTRLGGLRVDTTNNSVSPVRRGVVGKAVLDAALGDEGLPPFTEYNQGYNTETQFINYVPKDAIVIIAETPRMEELIVPDGEDLLLFNTLGYYGVGRCQGQSSVGDVIKLFHKEDKPVRIEGQAEGVGFSVVTESKAIFVIRGCVAP